MALTLSPCSTRTLVEKGIILLRLPDTLSASGQKAVEARPGLPPFPNVPSSVPAGASVGMPSGKEASVAEGESEPLEDSCRFYNGEWEAKGTIVHFRKLSRKLFFFDLRAEATRPSTPLQSFSSEHLSGSRREKAVSEEGRACEGYSESPRRDVHETAIDEDRPSQVSKNSQTLVLPGGIFGPTGKVEVVLKYPLCADVKLHAARLHLGDIVRVKGEYVERWRDKSEEEEGGRGGSVGGCEERLLFHASEVEVLVNVKQRGEDVGRLVERPRRGRRGESQSESPHPVSVPKRDTRRSAQTHVFPRVKGGLGLGDGGSGDEAILGEERTQSQTHTAQTLALSTVKGALGLNGRGLVEGEVHEANGTLDQASMEKESRAKVAKMGRTMDEVSCDKLLSGEHCFNPLVMERDSTGGVYGLGVGREECEQGSLGESSETDPAYEGAAHVSLRGSANENRGRGCDILVDDSGVARNSLEETAMGELLNAENLSPKCGVLQASVESYVCGEEDLVLNQGEDVADMKVCKYWINTRECSNGSSCLYAHPEGAAFDRCRREWVHWRVERRRLHFATEGDPLNPHAKARKGARARVFAQWLVDTYTLPVLSSLSGVLDIAGGRGALSFALHSMHGIPTTLIDPRPRRLSRSEHRFMAKNPSTPLATTVELEFNAGDSRWSEILRLSSCLVGLHPDEATEAIVKAAVASRKPFAVVPCCVFPSTFLSRRVMVEGVESKVESYDQFVTYLSQLAERGGADVQIGWLNLEGKNLVIYCKGYRSS
eukprot:TRINITY_DN20608_c0_g1_i1.p1 TRINITY_DN20608_c0_g1~~TRINITY_DN20608_c0_g1_i1.p1  ORF type:complete len:772 (+),score=75.41 TRINITY_DN20608_c0_g1_i1:798-3113(+)